MDIGLCILFFVSFFRKFFYANQSILEARTTNKYREQLKYA